MRLLILFILASLTACVSDSSKRGALDDTGWPERPAEETFTCPEGTDLYDNTASDGVRTLTCRAINDPRPRGFELVWNANATLLKEARFDAEGLPSKMTRYYPDGTIRSVEVFEEGRTVQRESWYENGDRKSLRERTAEGVHIVKWQPDGQIQSEGKFVGERREGVWKEWRDGALEVANYQNGVRQGRVERTYLDGSVESGEAVDGARNGTWTRVGADGARMLVVEYRDGKRHGRFVQFHSNRQPAIEGRYIDDQKEGRWFSYYAGGSKRSEGEFRCGAKHGEWTSWHENRQIAEQGRYIGGVKVGQWQKFSETGRVTETRTFARDTPEPNCPL